MLMCAKYETWLPGTCGQSIPPSVLEVYILTSSITRFLEISLQRFALLGKWVGRQAKIYSCGLLIIENTFVHCVIIINKLPLLAATGSIRRICMNVYGRCGETAGKENSAQRDLTLD